MTFQNPNLALSLNPQTIKSQKLTANS